MGLQTILGAGGQIGTELALALKRYHTDKIRLVSRNPQNVNSSDMLLRADLLDLQQTFRAVKGSHIVYLTAGLPMDTKLWEQQWPVIMRNVIEACKAHRAKLVFFDNTYMYAQTDTTQRETSEFTPSGRKGAVRASIASELIDAITRREIKAMICRAPEFYGPDKTQSITNLTIFEKLKKSRTAIVFLRDDTVRTLIYTPDASRAMALLGNTPDAYNQTWHLPCDDNRMTYRQIITKCEEILGKKCEYRILKKWQLTFLGLFNQQLRDTAELLPRYNCDNMFDSTKFKRRFPDFCVTPYSDGFEKTLLV
ncbi:NAD-dependent epimerase/dehydratase family protein [Alteromonas ponticola]|uniref:NAD-dependent epimerase/dehydratase family protein n=1 Tax=Alteromonas aquimaris TaxID=2998417 RepID=A0ABT3P6Y2_9ALTE|nr:NAD-dependent epimerase/dehydratase family protein [Alteromonas aquimaris]MCW8107836.1 NAD-dependent epimerase/dehydratase family protein [Alteromonas aquimaris]